GSVGGFWWGGRCYILDILGRKATGLGVGILSALSTLALLWLDNFYVAFAIYSFVAFSFASVAYVSAMEIFPPHKGYRHRTDINSRQAGGVLAPPLLISVSQIGYEYGIYGLFLFWMVGVVAYMLWGVFGVEAKGKPIEDIV
ncbi:MAG: MFS transporter, partial [Aquificota bacterium]|nr:MFS transporter [Aquificota bacterium]